MYSLLEADISKEVAEDVFVFFDVNVTLIRADLQAVLLLAAQLLFDLTDVPREACNDDANDLARVCDRTDQIIRQLSLVLLLSLVRRAGETTTLVHPYCLHEPLLLSLRLLHLFHKSL